jgi:redox-sensitive bicupin YhaK (pirin superfamily)
MINIIRAGERHFKDLGWLKTYWLFSFSDYYDPDNMRFGSLRVFNDDKVAPGKGFGMHRHSEMEIVTIILEGKLTHADNMGHEFTNQPGDVQRMTAGTGVRHSEFNTSDEELHLYQIWIEPRESGLEPSYEQKHFEESDWENALLPLASGQEKQGAVYMHADATIYRGSLETGKDLTYENTRGRKLFLYLASGRMNLNQQTLNPGDQARMELDEPLRMKAEEASAFILIDLPV